MPVSPPDIDAAKKKGLRKKIWVLVVILSVLAGLYYFAFDYILPKVASFATPHKWSMIPLRQTREVVRNYFGEPLPESNDKTGDIWSSGSKGKMYFLYVHYISDTIASGYSIHYQCKTWFGARDYLIDSLSIR
jgi:hypothetical protein